MEETTLERASLGQIAKLGYLYNARTDNFCGFSILTKPPPSSAVTVVDNHSIENEFILTDNCVNKFDKLDIKAELKASVMAGLLSLKGHGHYLQYEKQSARAVRSTLLYNIQTKVEQLNLFSEDLRECFSMDALSIPEATHVVVEVWWGAKSTITMEYANTENGDVTKISGTLDAELRKLSFGVTGKGKVNYEKSEENKVMSFSLKMFADILPNNESLPQTFDEALELMSKMPTLIQTANQGKGKPIQYKLVHISKLEKYLKVGQMADRLIKQIDEQSIIGFIDIFDDISAVKQELYDLYYDMTRHQYCVRKEDIVRIGETKTKLMASESSLRSKLAKSLVDVRSGKANASALEEVRTDFIRGDYSVVKVRDILNSFHNVVEKMKFTDVLAEEGVTYIGFGGSIETEQNKNSSGDIYVLFFGDKLKEIETNKKLWSSNRHLFLSLVRDSKKDKMKGTRITFMAVDCDIRPEVAVSEGVKDCISICHFKNGKYINFDVLSEKTKLNDICLARSREVKNPFADKPNKRIDLKLRCPASITGECVIEDHVWVCEKCAETIEYDFEDNFYCKCGSAVDNSYEFKCNSRKHGLDYVKYDESTLKSFLKKTHSIINILIIGEIGAGKSTWINAIANYISYPSLEVAEQSEPLCLIPSTFTITDKSGGKRVITTGIDTNEVQSTGCSTTQRTKSYLFQWGDRLVRLIDTPGFAHTHCDDQNTKNFYKILNYVYDFGEINGICVLLKTNYALVNQVFHYCERLLSYCGEANKMVFCFTNSRSTVFRPGDSLTHLKLVIAKKTWTSR